jgi:hypothetical protein
METGDRRALARDRSHAQPDRCRFRAGVQPPLSPGQCGLSGPSRRHRAPHAAGRGEARDATGTSFGTPTTGIIAPGFIYSQNGIDFGVEALIPATRQSGTNVGFIASLHIPFEAFLPAVASKPLFGGERP